MATAVFRSLRRRDLASASHLAYRVRVPFFFPPCDVWFSTPNLNYMSTMKLYVCLIQLNGNTNASAYSAYGWAGVARTFSSKPVGNEVIGIGLGTTNSCVSLIEGKLRNFCWIFFQVELYTFWRHWIFRQCWLLSSPTECKGYRECWGSTNNSICGCFYSKRRTACWHTSQMCQAVTNLPTHYLVPKDWLVDVLMRPRWKRKWRWYPTRLRGVPVVMPGLKQMFRVFTKPSCMFHFEKAERDSRGLDWDVGD